MELGSVIRRRGRPFGHRLSELSKDRIRRSRIGTKHKQETKDKISKSLSAYFKKRDSLSVSLEYEYTDVSSEAVEWIFNNREDIDESESVMTERRLSYFKQLEISMGHELEQLFGHNNNPEILLMLKQELSDAGIDLAEFQSLL